MKKKLVSIVMPTYNCQNIVEDALKSVKKQTYRHIELIVVDSFSTDNTAKIARKYAKVYSFGKDPSQKDIFASPFQINYGMAKAKGEYVYIMDSDMRLTPTIIASCVKLMESRKVDAIIIPEESYGESFWARCRKLERDCYDTGEISYSAAARFVRKTVWDKLHGVDNTLGGAYDGDLQMRLNTGGYKTVKVKGKVFHYEGNLTLGKQMRKKFMYGKTVLAYLKKHKDNTSYIVKEYSLIKPDFIRNFHLLLQDPIHAIGMICMKVAEYASAFFGVIYSFVSHEEVKILTAKK